MCWYLRLLNPDVAFLIMWVSYEISTDYLLLYAVTICVCFLPASGTIPRKVNSMITSPYLNCKTESPAQPNDWKWWNVLQSINCGLGLQDIFFSRKHLA